MNPDHSLFTAALGLQPPWEVTSVDFDAEAKRIDIEVGFTRGGRFGCPECGATGQPVHATRRRSWQHLHFFEHRATIHASVPRVRCGACGKTAQVAVPWARPGSGFTQLFEALVVTLCAQMPVQAVARHLGVGDDALWRVLHHYVDAARAREDFSEVTAEGIDGTAARRVHDTISVFHDLEQRRVLYAGPGRDQHTDSRVRSCNHASPHGARHGSRSSRARWKRGEISAISRDRRSCMAILMGIHTGLHYLFREPQRGGDWVRKRNAVFGGARALNVMQRGEITDLIDVRGYRAAERGL
jgi:hypothetical protein